MESVWENSVMIGLRDAQREGMDKLVVDHPGYFAALMGKFEQGAGDAILANANRYFLFELKGTVLDVRSEWSRTIKDEQGNDQIAPKQVHKKLMEEVRKLSNSASGGGTVAKNWVDLSMRCHLFAYWHYKKVSPPPEHLLGEILASPYISTTLTRLLVAEEDTIKRSGFLGKTSLRRAEEVVRELSELGVVNANGSFECIDAVRACDLLNGALGIRAPNSEVFGLGLEKDAFAGYLNFLRDGLADEAMKAVVYCPQNGLFRYVERLSDLVPAFECAVDPELEDAVWSAIRNEPDLPDVSEHQRPKP